jgi:hypothetical protein
MRSRDPPTSPPGGDDRFAGKQQQAANGPGVANQSQAPRKTGRRCNRAAQRQVAAAVRLLSVKAIAD